MAGAEPESGALTLGEVLIERGAIETRVREMGRQLARDIEADLTGAGQGAWDHPDQVVMLPILTGAIVFTDRPPRMIPTLIVVFGSIPTSGYTGSSAASPRASS